VGNREGAPVGPCQRGGRGIDPDGFRTGCPSHRHAHARSTLLGDDRSDEASDEVAWDLKRPGPAVDAAREQAAADGHESVPLKEVSMP
jgi:hypothetical protein